MHKITSIESVQGQMTADELFGYWLVDDKTHANGVGIMYMMGTEKECKEGQLRLGVRSHSHIIKVC